MEFDNIICMKCPIYQFNCAKGKKTKYFSPVGNRAAEIMLVGAFPDRAELSYNEPFAGLGNDVMEFVLQEAELNMDKIRVAHVARCGFNDGHAPVQKDIKNCLVYLNKEIKTVRPKVIGLLGSTATNVYLKGKISELHGIPVWSDIYRCWLLPLYGPIYVSKFTRDSSQFRTFLKDFILLNELKNIVKTEKADTQIKVVKTLDEAAEAADILCKAKWFSFDLETTGLDPHTSKILCGSFSIEEGKAIVIPFEDARVFSVEEQESIRQLYSKIFGSVAYKAAQNGKFDIKHLKARGIEVRNYVFDTMLAHYLLDSGAAHDLGSLAKKYTSMPKFKEYMTEYIKTGNIRKAPLELLHKYAGRDADATLRLCNIFKIRFNAVELKGLKKTFLRIVMPMTLLLADMEFRGIGVDENYISQIKELLGKKLDRLIQKMLSDSSLQDYMKKNSLMEFNFNSPKQLGEFLYGFLKLKIKEDVRGVDKNIPKQGSTNMKTLKELDRIYKLPFFTLLEEHRKLQKFYSTYIVPFGEHGGYVNPVTRRVHTSFLQHGTATGRLSSKAPNLQNIPKRESSEDKELSATTIRNMYVAKQDCIFIEADYSQIEFRVWAHMSGDEKLINYIAKKDVHSAIAAEIHGISVDEVTKLQRDIAKATVYGVMYGRGSGAISKEYDIPIDEAFRIVQSFKMKFAKAFTWFEQMKAFTRQKGYVETLFYRRRQLPDIYNKEDEKRAAAERQAINTPIQSTAFDIVSLGMLRLQNTLAKRSDLDATILLTIHDSVVLEVKKEQLDEIVKIVVSSLSNPIKLKVVLPVGVEVGKRLGQMIKYKGD